MGGPGSGKRTRPETFPALRYLIERERLSPRGTGEMYIEGVLTDRHAYRKRLASVVARYGGRCYVTAHCGLIDEGGRFLRSRRIYERPTVTQ